MPEPTPKHPLLDRASQVLRAGDLEAIAALAAELPAELDPSLLRVADEVAFALGRLHRHDEAISVLERAYAVAPTWRRASGLAWHHYSAAMREPRRVRPAQRAQRAERRETLRRGFRRWIAEALRLDPQSVKDLYRLGLWEAQLESAHDKVALRAFLGAIRAYRELDPQTRVRRHDLHRFHVCSLYAGARSALRLEKNDLARRLAFECVRANRTRQAIAWVHVHDLAGRACLARGELDDAERAFRLALGADGPPRRDHVHVRMAEVLRRRGDVAGACAWIEQHIRPERRACWVWRALGDLRLQAGRTDDALAAYHAALEGDRGGRHLTLTRIGLVHEAAGRLRKAERAFADAVEAARRTWSKEHVPALRGLARVQGQRGKHEEAKRTADRAAREEQAA